MELILKNFPDLSKKQIKQFEQLSELYHYWNERINVISRKDIDQLYTRHVLHSLAIAKFIQFKDDTMIMDVGTGGGFPGIPLAILFPNTSYYLIDVIAKKIKVVNEISSAIGLKNVIAEQKRASAVTKQFDFIISRAVTNMPDFVTWVRSTIRKKNHNDRRNGIIYLKGGDLQNEMEPFKNILLTPISNYFNAPFFETKKIVYLPLKYKG